MKCTRKNLAGPRLFVLVLALFNSNLFCQNNVLSFDGVNDDISIAYNSALDYNLNSKFTVEAWFKTSVNQAVFVSNLVHNSPFQGYELGFHSNKLFVQVINIYPANTLRIETSANMNDNQWHHVAFVYHGNSACDLYIDGALTIPVITHNSLTGNVSNGQNLHIGSRANTIFRYSGLLDEVRIWSDDLCQEEIVARKNCMLVGNEHNLEAYYSFNQGVANGSNSNITTLVDGSSNGNTGALANFALSGASSNWLSGSPVTGTCSYSGKRSGTSIPSLCETVGISEGNNSAVRVFPNPFSDHISIEGAEVNELFHIVDVTGRTVKQFNLSGSTATIETGDLHSGYYLLIGVGRSGKTITRILKP